jgi:hypothetical protein
MTIQQICLFTGLYLLFLVVVIILTRAAIRRVTGALAGAALAGAAMPGIIALGERAGWWHFVMSWEPFYLILMSLSVIPCGFIFLITWRIARRFGAPGLALVVLIVAIVGPLRDRWYITTFPQWGSYGPGAAPLLATSAAYVILGVLGHTLMRLVAGPAAFDRLANRPWQKLRQQPTLLT